MLHAHAGLQGLFTNSFALHAPKSDICPGPLWMVLCSLIRAADFAFTRFAWSLDTADELPTACMSQSGRCEKSMRRQSTIRPSLRERKGSENQAARNLLRLPRVGAGEERVLISASSFFRLHFFSIMPGC